ncbi:hypothetical protein NQ176_g9625 [Zarea fungicola]|uniref:Uncharacterized protein n=1 Tax=Zarea fungicola TaxID=93591 RepID=A0ACC1MKZ1_9HYPO|nr:hypothetical protein NQ176_g9625 [Lecanicillium fungicola]
MAKVTGNDNRAILIGINDYTYPYVKQLNAAVKDVDDIETWLTKQKIVLEENVFKFTTESRDQSRLPTYENIVKGFEDIGKETPDGALIFVHYSGHGSYKSSELKCREKENKYANKNHDNILIFHKGYLHDFELSEILEGLGKSRAVFVVLDCCFSAQQDRDGSPFADRDVKGDQKLITRMAYDPRLNFNDRVLDRKVLENLDQKPNTWWDRPRSYTVLAACAKNEKAYEDKDHGNLTRWLLDALDNSYNQAGTFTYQRLYGYICKNLEQELKTRVFKQTPELKGHCNRLLFTREVTDVSQHIFVSRVIKNEYKKEMKVQICAGRAHCIDKGAEFDIYGSSTDPPFRISVCRVGGLVSEAKVTDGIHHDKSLLGCLAVPAPRSTPQSPQEHWRRVKELRNENDAIGSFFSFCRGDESWNNPMKHGETFSLNFKNTSKAPLYFALFEICPWHEVKQLHPAQGGACEPVLGGEGWDFTMRVAIPEGKQGGENILKV